MDNQRGNGKVSRKYNWCTKLRGIVEKKADFKRLHTQQNPEEIKLIIGNVIESREEENKGTEIERKRKLYTRYI